MQAARALPAVVRGTDPTTEVFRPFSAPSDPSGAFTAPGEALASETMVQNRQMDSVLSHLAAKQFLLLSTNEAIPLPKLMDRAPSPAENNRKTPPSVYYRPAIGLGGGYFGWQAVRGKQPDSLPYRPAATRPLETVQGSFQLTLPLHRKWALQTGFVYARTTQRLEWEHAWETQRHKTLYNYYTNGQVDTSVASVTVEMRRRIRHYNHWTQIGIPLAVQYRRVFKKWCLAPQMGLQANWLLPAKGIVINQSLNPDAALFEAQYQRRFLLQGQAGVELAYAIGKNWYVSASPRAQFDLTPRTAKNATAERFLWYGVQVGVWRRVGF